MKRYIIRNPEPRRWQVIAAHRAKAIARDTSVTETEREQSYNRATTVTVRTKKAAQEFIGKIGGTLVDQV